MKQNVVVYIITKLELGGAQKVCLSLYNKAYTGYDTLLITGAEGKLITEVHNNHNVIFLPTLKREFSFFGIFQEIKTLIFLIKQLRIIKKKYAEVIVHTHSTKAGILGRWAAFFARIQTRVHTIHGYSFHAHQAWFIWLLHYACELLTSFVTTHYICVSSADIKTGKRLFPFFSQRSSIIRAAVDTLQFVPAQRATSQEVFVFGTISCFKPQKNLFDLLEAFKYVHALNPSTKLEIIGDGTQRTAIQAWIQEHNLQQSIILHGWQTAVAPFMKQWNSFVLSSLWEGLPCAIVEARLMKLPVIAYNTGGISDVIDHYRNGILVPQKDVYALSQAMQEIVQNQALYQSLQNAENNFDEFTDESMRDHHHQLYQQLLGK